MKKLLFISNITNSITNFVLPSYYACEKMGIEFHLASNLNNFDYENNPYKDIVLHNIKCNRNPLSFDNIYSYKELNRIIKENQIDYIHCNTPIGGVLGRLCASKNKLEKVIYTAHGFHFYKGAPLLNNIVYKNIEYALAHKTDAIMTINNEDFHNANNMKLKKDGKVYKVDGVGIDVNSFFNVSYDKNTLKKTLCLSDDDYICIGIGRIESNKNFEETIESIYKTNDKRIKLLICGDGPLKRKCEKIVKKRNLEKNILFLGYRNDIPKLLKISNCYISLSKREGLPRSLMEAMAAGLPCIVSDIRGNNDLIKNGINGFLVNDSNECAEKINQLIHDESMSRKMQINNIRLIKNYDVENVKKQIEEIYKKEL